jgi:hypothetical protein
MSDDSWFEAPGHRNAVGGNSAFMGEVIYVVAARTLTIT